jgi:hypothetical protein
MDSKTITIGTPSCWLTCEVRDCRHTTESWRKYHKRPNDVYERAPNVKGGGPMDKTQVREDICKSMEP